LTVAFRFDDMNRERALVVAAAVVAVVAVVGAVGLPGAIATPREERPNPGRVAVDDVTLQPTAVGGSTVDLAVGVALQHYGNPTQNVSVRVRAVDSTTGFLAAERRVPVGTLSGEGLTETTADLSVEREGGYRIEVTVFRGDRPMDRTQATIAGLDSLPPEYARTNVTFVDEPALPAVSTAVVDAGDNETTLRVTTTLTNEGESDSEGLELSVVLRQAESNLVASRSRTEVTPVRSGRTATVDTTVTVPAEYNYYVDVVLWKDDVLVDSVRGVVNLDPTRTISVDERREEVNISVGDFEEDPEPRPTAAQDATSSGAPGFTAVAALAALLVAALAAHRRTR
jgi:PGF-CTERM protein